jgi:hypothetical protein
MLAEGTVGINTRKAADLWRDLPETYYAVVEFYLLANAMLVRSYTEFVKLAETVVNRYPRAVERVLVEPPLPAFTRRRPDHPTVVIWAPQRASAELALHAGGMDGFPGEVVAVSADAATVGNLRVVPADDPTLPDVLSRAGCIVCVEPNDPGDAVAFARHGFGIVAPRTSGAHEFVPDVVVWDAANATRLHHAVSDALARPASLGDPYVAPPQRPAPPPAPVPAGDLPLVSIVIPTYNRPDDLRAALRSVAAQTYPRIEAVVVNDAGASVDHVVRDFPFARLIDHDVNGGSNVAARTGALAAASDYLAFLPDDDSIYPDHIERVMYALVRSGAKIAHGSGMLRYVERAADGSWLTVGFHARLLADTLTPNLALVATPVNFNAIVHHRSVFDEAGYWMMDSCLSDLELHMRQGVRYVFVHADSITFEFREHAGNQAKKNDFAREALRLYDVIHPAPDRPLLRESRMRTVDIFSRRRSDRPAFEPTLSLPPTPMTPPRTIEVRS